MIRGPRDLLSELILDIDYAMLYGVKAKIPEIRRKYRGLLLYSQAAKFIGANNPDGDNLWDILFSLVSGLGALSIPDTPERGDKFADTDAGQYLLGLRAVCILALVFTPEGTVDEITKTLVRAHFPQVEVSLN